MRIISADSAAAILDARFEPTLLVATASVIVEPPYREAHMRLAEPIFNEVENNRNAIVREAELCLKLLEKVKADVVHLDATLGSVPVDELSPVELSNMKISGWARQNILLILPKLRKIAGEIRRLHGIEMIAIGKQSIPVRLAELTAGSEAILFACDKVVEEGKSLLLGLPTECQHHIGDGKVYLHSLIPGEHDVRGYAEDQKRILERTAISEILNPVARGFRMLKITPKT